MQRAAFFNISCDINHECISLLGFEHVPVRHRGVKEYEWQNGVDGKVGMARIVMKCSPDCQASSSSAGQFIPPHCNTPQPNGDSNSELCLNFYLQFNQTGSGYGETEYQISMRSPPPSDDNFIEKLPTRRFITLPQHVVVFGLPHAKRRQNATFKVVPSGDSAADAETSFLFSTPPSVSTDGTLSFVLRPGLYGKGYGYSYGNASFSLQMSTTDDEVYGLCASQDLDDKSDIGGHVEKSCVTSRLYAGRRPYNEHKVLQSRPVANFIITNFSIVVWPVHNAQYFQVKIPSPRKFLEYLKNFHYDTHLTFY